jgi:hypothetical protein
MQNIKINGETIVLNDKLQNVKIFESLLKKFNV